MILTTKGRYAINAILEVANNNGSQPLSLSKISQKQNISLAYLEQIFCNLKKAGLVKSIKGPGGGYIMNQDRRISAYDIIKATGEKIKMTSCANDNNCVKLESHNNKCQTHHIWKGLEKTIADYFDSITISNQSQQNKEVLDV